MIKNKISVDTDINYNFNSNNYFIYDVKKYRRASYIWWR